MQGTKSNGLKCHSKGLSFDLTKEVRQKGSLFECQIKLVLHTIA